MYYLETIAAIGRKVDLNIQINELMKLNEYQRSRSLFDLSRRSLRFQNLKLVSLGNYWVIWNQISYESLRVNGNQISYESLWVNGNENLYKWVGSHDQGGRHAYIW